MVSEAFGKTFVDTTLAPTTTGTTTNNLRFPGQYEDQETGTHYNFMRTYLPYAGRYGETDPIGLKGGINLYLYAAANPLSMYDNLGKTPAAALCFVPGVGQVSCGAVLVAGLGAAWWIARNTKPKPLDDSVIPGAANDEDYERKDCPPDCEAWRRVLNQMYFKIDNFARQNPTDRVGITVMWMQFKLEVKRYEKQCGKYVPPPSRDIHDVYGR
jgi:RHS repeat-associated protein